MNVIPLAGVNAELSRLKGKKRVWKSVAYKPMTTSYFERINDEGEAAQSEHHMIASELFAGPDWDLDGDDCSLRRLALDIQ